jgi:membrane protein implicated in regulation of membrane protease activity
MVVTASVEGRIIAPAQNGGAAMAELGESGPKANELYLGIVDLFAVILPGAIIAFVFEKGFDIDSRYQGLRGAQGWVVFLAASYVIGHLISALGGLLLDKIYDTGFKLSKEHSGYFRIRIRARDVVQSILKSFYSDKDNAMEWAGIIARLGSQAASMEIDRLEADSKFFRSLTTVLVLGWPIYIFIITVIRHPALGNTQTCWIRIVALILGMLSFLSIVALRYFVGREEDQHEKRKTKTVKQGQAHSETHLPANNAQASASLEDRVAKERESAQALAVPCWRATLGTGVIWVVLVVMSGLLLAPIHAGIAAGCAILAIFSSWRYMERRLKRTRLTYAYAIALSL